MVGVDGVEFLAGAEEFAEGNVTVAVPVHPLEPKRTFLRNRTGGRVKVKDVNESALVVRLPLIDREAKLVGHFRARDVTVAIFVPRAQPGPGGAQLAHAKPAVVVRVQELEQAAAKLR